ncbi:DUF441 domain-containing protein [Acinetobacter rudis]|uniref:UPF0756 membrane protein RFH47_06455 n=1 Tax=Acinetobacter rudis TaxID=632955 RepID=A0AAW8JCE9_9GAMM|nr:DUF441 domain-containing protein [Acinetobacter rudis]MDQ8935364.1 DUF441 domain-containing protein [Acinetobacter rudis]MDQ8952326.1 DUF441 domain-containing protein [Acinetobacter rudis]MDQ9017627.1 DUF441 domain-containing protein [Acinetobacter rudis]
MSISALDLNLMVLIVLLACGVLSHNSAITIAAAVLIIFRLTPLQVYFPFLQNYALHIGIVVLTIGVLTPIASGKIPGDDILKSFFNWKSVLAILVGITVAWLGGRGVKLMSNQPNIVAGLLIGTVAGVALLRGVPVGPLIAAGILSLLIGYN